MTVLPDLVRATVWRLELRTWWGGTTAVEVANARYPEDALEGFEAQFLRSCLSVVQMQFFCLVEQRWKRLSDRDRQAAMARVAKDSRWQP